VKRTPVLPRHKLSPKLLKYCRAESMLPSLFIKLLVDGIITSLPDSVLSSPPERFDDFSAFKALNAI
jgi:hypothetical protein